MKAETNQLESFIKSRSQYLDLEIERMRSKLHQPSTKAAATTSDSSHDISKRHSSDSGQRNSNAVHVSPTGRNLSAKGQGIQLISKEIILPNRNYSPHRKSNTSIDPSIMSGSRSQNNRNRTHHSGFDREKSPSSYGYRESNISARSQVNDDSDDSDLSDGPSRSNSRRERESSEKEVEIQIEAERNNNFRNKNKMQAKKTNKDQVEDKQKDRNKNINSPINILTKVNSKIANQKIKSSTDSVNIEKNKINSNSHRKVSDISVNMRNLFHKITSGRLLYICFVNITSIVLH